MAYHYGKSIINSKLRFDFSTLNPKYGKIEKNPFEIECVVYCNNKKVSTPLSKTFYNTSINDGIRTLLIDEVEKTFTFYYGNNYVIKLNIFRIKKTIRHKYKKTPVLIETTRRRYLMQEKINTYLAPLTPNKKGKDKVKIDINHLD